MKIIKRILDKNFYLHSLVSFIAFYILLPSVALAKPPTIEITSPSHGAVDVKGEIPITAEASDNTGVSQVEFFIDGDFLGLDLIPESGDIWSYLWDTNLVNDGFRFITAKATDTSGKTSTDRIGVTVDNVLANDLPIAEIDYSWDGYKYYFYPYECYDPDGYIVKYKYEIISGSESDTYSCCEFCDEDWDLCPMEECEPPDTNSNFSLFFVCPWVSYEFPALGTYIVKLTVQDNYGDWSLPAEDTITLSSPGITDDMYVGKINSFIKSTGSGSTLMFKITVQYDSDLDGQSSSDDLPLSGVLVEMQLERDSVLDGEFDENNIDGNFTYSDSGTTDRDGEIGFSARRLEPGDYKAEIINLTDSNGKQWLKSLDRGNPHYKTIWP